MTACNPAFKANVETAERNFEILRTAADNALASWRGPLGRRQDLLEFELFATAQQFAARSLNGIQRVDSGEAFKS